MWGIWLSQTLKKVFHVTEMDHVVAIEVIGSSAVESASDKMVRDNVKLGNSITKQNSVISLASGKDGSINSAAKPTRDLITLAVASASEIRIYVVDIIAHIGIVAYILTPFVASPFAG